MDRCGFEREGRRRGRQSRGDAPQGGFSFRPRLYLLSETGREDPRRRARQDGPGLDSGDEDLAAQREALRHASGIEQARDGRKIRRRAGVRLAPQLRRGPRAASGGRSPQSALRSPLRRDSRRRAAPHRVVERHRGPHDALLGVRDTPGAGPPRRTAGGGPRQQPAGHHQEPERDFGRGHFGVQPSDCRALRLRIRRGAGLCEGLFPGRPGRDRLPDGGRRQSGPAGLTPPPHFRCARRRFRRQSSADPFLIRFCVWGAEPVLRADGLHPTENDAAP